MGLSLLSSTLIAHSNSSYVAPICSSSDLESAYKPSLGFAWIIESDTCKYLPNLKTSDFNKSAIGLKSTPPSPYFV